VIPCDWDGPRIVKLAPMLTVLSAGSFRTD